VVAAASHQRRQHVHWIDELSDAVVFENGLHHAGVMKSEDAFEAARDRPFVRDGADRRTHQLALAFVLLPLAPSSPGVDRAPGSRCSLARCSQP